MGLDSVELVIRFEVEFGIEIADRDAESITTPREAADLVCARIDLVPAPICLTREAFNRVREALQWQGMTRRSITPRLAFAEIYDRSTLRQDWYSLGDRIGARQWPRLTRPWFRPLTLTIPRGCETVWGLARHIATWDPRVPAGHTSEWWPEGVLLRIRQITSEELGIKTFNDDDHYVRDLYVD